jgi:outer membrane protein
MTYRKAGVDVGLSYRYQQTWGTLRVSVLRDVGDYSAGSELDVGYSRDFHGERWVLRPDITVAWRDANLNNYYFGVRPDEALPDRPAYAPGDGVNVSVGLYASYGIWDNWRLLGGVSVTALDSGIRNSPIVRDDLQPAVYVGAVYDFGTALTRKDDGGVPLLIKVFYGQAAQDGCHLVRIVSLQCVSVDSDNRTSIAGIHLGRPFLKRVHGWPLDFNGYVGLLYRDENGLQSNGVQIDAYMKAFYYGFPWSDRVNTRFGFGIGISYADEVPWPEVTSQASRDRPTSNLLNYLDPTLDVNVGDIFSVDGWRDTYFGVGVSHRSGIFASSRLLGSVDGGSNYIYGYLEKSF